MNDLIISGAIALLGSLLLYQIQQNKESDRRADRIEQKLAKIDAFCDRWDLIVQNSIENQEMRINRNYAEIHRLEERVSKIERRAS